MRVLYYHQHFSTPDGAAGTRSYEFAKRLIARGHRVTMVCGSFGIGRTGLDGDFVGGHRQGTVEGINVIEFELPYSNRDNFFRRSLTFLRFALRSIGVAMREDYDLVFATSTPLTAGIPGIFARLIRRKPFVFEIRDLWPELPREMKVITNPIVLAALSVLEWVSYKAANGHIGLSPGIVEGVARFLPDDAAVEMIPNGCDIDLFGRGEPKRPEGVAEDEMIAIFSGAQGLANGVDAALDAAAVLIARGRDDIRLVFIGDGMLNEHLRMRAAEEGLDNCVFLKPVPKRDLVAILRGADVGMQLLANFPCFYRGTSPNKFFDYIATGLPVLNNYPGWLAWLIEDNNCGRAVPAENPEAFADALVWFADNADARKQMGANARKLAKKEFDRGMLADRFVDYLERTARC